MDSIQIQASKLWNLLFADETAATYQNTLNLTGTILKEIAQLIWLIICSAFVFGAWFADTSVRSGKSIRDWLDRKIDPDSVPTDQKEIAETSKSLLDTGRVGIANLLNQAREQLNIDPQEMPSIERTAKAIKPDPAKSNAKAIEPVKSPTPVASASTTTASTPSSTLPTNKPFDKNADTTTEPTPTPSTQTVGSSVGAGSPSSDGGADEVIREDVYDESSQYDD